MFSYELPDGGLHTNCYYDEQGKIRFDPPVWEQRYTTVRRILEDKRWSQHFKKIVDFGCSEMGLFPILRRIAHIEEILEVDIDEDILKENLQRVKPLTSDYLNPRKKPLHVEVLKGSIASSVEQLRQVDAVIAIEIIEHMYEKELEKVPHNIFGFMQPKLAVFTTPNSDFNVLFDGLLRTGFRHYDHKFEWTRKEFLEWANNICSNYPNYSVAFMGMGAPPASRQDLGFSTQAAIFVRNDIIGKELVLPLKLDLPADTDPEVQYQILYAGDYPHETRTDEECIIVELVYQMNRIRQMKKYYDEDLNEHKIPVDNIKEWSNLEAYGEVSKEYICELLTRHGYKIEAENVVLWADDNYEQLSDDCATDGTDEEPHEMVPFEADGEEDWD